MKMLLVVYAVMLCLFFLYVYDYSRGDKTGSTEASKRPAAGSLSEKYVMVTFQSGIEYWKSGLKGFEDAAQLFNVTVEYRGRPIMMSMSRRPSSSRSLQKSRRGSHFRQ